MVFSIVNALLFKPLPVQAPNRLVWAYSTLPGSTEPDDFSYLDYTEYRAQTDTFSELFAYDDLPVRLYED
jgi:hypothetical protein